MLIVSSSFVFFSRAVWYYAINTKFFTGSKERTDCGAEEPPHVALIENTHHKIKVFLQSLFFFLHTSVSSLNLTSQLIRLHLFLSPGDHTPIIFISFWKLIPTLFFPRTGGNIWCTRDTDVWHLSAVNRCLLFALLLLTPAIHLDLGISNYLPCDSLEKKKREQNK